MAELMFEGIATLEESEDETKDLDIYATVQLHRIGNFITWYGTFSLVTPSVVKPEGTYDMELSDGRRCKVEVRLDEKGQYMFRGLGLPPGYMNPGGEVVGLERPTPKTGSRVLSNILFAASAASMTASFWIAGRGMELAGTAAIALIAAVAAHPKR